MEREQRKLLQAHYADAVPLNLLKEEQGRIVAALKGITSQMAAYQAECTTTAQNLNDALTLLDNCGRVYKLADDFQRRCFNQAIFSRILVHDDLTLDTEYLEPFDTLLNPNICVLKSEFEKQIHGGICEGQFCATKQLTLADFLKSIKTQTRTKIRNFFSAGLSTDQMVRETGLEFEMTVCFLINDEEKDIYFKGFAQTVIIRNQME